MRITLALFLAVAVALPLAAQDRKSKKAPAEPKVWMCKKGDLLWEEKFDGAELSKDWH